MFGWLLWWRPPALLRVVIVNLKQPTDEALRGVLWSGRGPWLQLRETSIVPAHGDPQPIDGEVLVPRENVAFIQVVP
jgi:hypothetical protein